MESQLSILCCIKWLREARKLTGKPIAVLTNSSLLSCEKILKSLSTLDLIVAKLDAADQRLFKAVNRPAKNLKVSQVINGIKNLRRKATGRLAVQSMFFRRLDHRLSNFPGSPVEALAEIVSSIMPDEVQINTPMRPPAEPFISPLTKRELQVVAKVFSEKVSEARVVSRADLGL